MMQRSVFDSLFYGRSEAITSDRLRLSVNATPMMPRYLTLNPAENENFKSIIGKKETVVLYGWPRVCILHYTRFV
jgi:hypothetical protein